MLSISADKIDSLFESIASSYNLYLPVDNESGKAEFEQWEKGKKLSSALKTVRSAKDFFFPKVENLVNYKREGKSITVVDPRKDLGDFVVFGVRGCDAASFAIIDDVYLKMDPVDSYYKNRRDHGTVVTLACTEPAQTCFCSTYNIDATNPKGDVTSWLADGKYFFQANTDKGNALIEKIKGLLSESDDKAVEAQKKEVSEKIEKLGISGRSSIVFVIGGSCGLHSLVMKRADERISFSDMTFPHQLMRVILTEQIYRAFRIARNEPYHK